MFITLKAKIWLTVVLIVLLFTFFTLFYFPHQQRQFFLKNYNKKVQHLANTVALGVGIALNEQNYKGVQTAMEFVKENPGLKFVSLLQRDTVWNGDRTRFTIRETVFKTYPENVQYDRKTVASQPVIVKEAPFNTSLMAGAVLLGFSTDEINENQSEVRLTSIIVSSTICFLGMLIGLWLSRNISIPVLALRNAAVRVGKGDLTPVVKSSSRDEIGDLTKAFNKMVQDLARAREELNSTNRELSDTNTTLHSTLTKLQAAQAQLVQSEKMASLGEMTAGIAHEIQNPLNFVTNFSDVNTELIGEMKEALAAGNIPEALTLAEDIRENNLKITLHGRRADSVVKNMLQHSRHNGGEKEETDLNTLVNEYFRLSYHGIRAKDPTFTADMQADLDEGVGKIEIVPQDIARVLLNLFNNAFYSVAQKYKKRTEDYHPQVVVRTKKGEEKTEIHVWDNGMGISQKELDKIYQPFFTTKPTGQGTGLGLSLSYEIITKGHRGELKVATEEGKYAEFTVLLPG